MRSLKLGSDIDCLAPHPAFCLSDYSHACFPKTVKHPALVFGVRDDFKHAFVSARSASDSPDLRFHDLRHTSASHLAMNGATQGELMEILGHRSPAMTRRYAHFSKKHIADLLQKTSNSLINPQGTSL